MPVESAIKTATSFDANGIGVRVINVLDMKQLDGSFLDLLEDNVPVLTIYNGNPFVLQSAVAKAVMEHKKPRPSVIRGHGFTHGTTGKLEDLLKYFRLDTTGLTEIIKQMFPELVL